MNNGGARAAQHLQQINHGTEPQLFRTLTVSASSPSTHRQSLSLVPRIRLLGRACVSITWCHTPGPPQARCRGVLKRISPRNADPRRQNRRRSRSKKSCRNDFPSSEATANTQSTFAPGTFFFREQSITGDKCVIRMSKRWTRAEKHSWRQRLTLNSSGVRHGTPTTTPLVNQAVRYCLYAPAPLRPRTKGRP